MTNNVIFFASGGARDGVGNLLLAAQKGLPQTAEAKRKVNRGEGKTCRLCCVRIGISNTALLPVLFSSKFVPHPASSSSVHSPPVPPSEMPFGDAPHAGFLLSLTLVPLKSMSVLKKDPRGPHLSPRGRTIWLLSGHRL